MWRKVPKPPLTRNAVLDMAISLQRNGNGPITYLHIAGPDKVCMWRETPKPPLGEAVLHMATSLKRNDNFSITYLHIARLDNPVHLLLHLTHCTCSYLPHKETTTEDH